MSKISKEAKPEMCSICGEEVATAAFGTFENRMQSMFPFLEGGKGAVLIGPKCAREVLPRIIEEAIAE